MKYLVEITETLQKQIEVEAESEQEAEDIVKSHYKSGAVELAAEDIKEITVTVLLEVY